MPTISYPQDGNDLCFAIEDESFWFRHRNNCILAMLEAFPPGGTIFDVGGGNGYVARAIQTSGISVVLVEPGHAGAQNALRRGIGKIVEGTLSDAVGPDRLHAVSLFDVLEHIESEDDFLREINRYLRPDGRLYITVPAFAWLWSNEDDAAGHFRRYTVASLSQPLVRAGFRIDYATYFFHFLPIPTYLLRTLPYRFGARRSTTLTLESMRAEHTLSPAVAAFLNPLMKWETARIQRRSQIPFGGSCLAVAHKF